jgi:uncharacterized protein YacL (UPF0231 family)
MKGVNAVRIQKILTIGCLTGALAAMPALAMAPKECVAGKATAASYTWNFRKEATGLLQDVQSEAAQVRNHAAKIQTFGREYEVSWQAHSNQLSRLKTEVDDMGAKLCRLMMIRRVVAPWQQEAIDRIAPQIQLIADNAQDAIHFVNNHQESLWQPAYQRYVSNLYHESKSLSNTVNNFEEYAHARIEYRQLESRLGMKTAS